MFNLKRTAEVVTDAAFTEKQLEVILELTRTAEMRVYQRVAAAMEAALKEASNG